MKPPYLSSALFTLFFCFSVVNFYASGLQFSVKIPVNNTPEAISLANFKIQQKTQEFIIAGPYQHYIEAMKAKQEIVKLGYSTLEIIAFFNHSTISIEDAFAIMDNRNAQDQTNKGFTLTTEEISELLLDVQNNDFFYTVQIGLFTEENVNNFFDFPKQYDERITTKGNLRYTYGTFNSINEARNALTMVKDYGLSDAFVIAFDHLERISIDRAIEIEQQKIDDLTSEK